MEEIPAVVREAADEELLELALVENVQRRDLDPIEKARGYRRMIEQLALTQEQVAAKVGLNRATVANHLRLLDLPEQAREALSKGLIQMGHARALASIDDSKILLRLLGRVVREGLSVRETERAARQASSPSQARSARAETSMGTVQPPRPPWVAALERRLRDAFGVKVTIHNRPGHRGRIELEYADREELNRLIERLAPKPEL